jgi:hypothetical protein
MNGWLSFVLIEIIQSPEQEGNKSGTLCSVAFNCRGTETSFIVKFELYPVESIQNCYLKTDILPQQKEQSFHFDKQLCVYSLAKLYVRSR